MKAVFETSINSLPLLGRGKVRDIYDAGEDRLLVVTTDRLSAFDVIMPDPLPGKGQILTAMADFWFARFSRIIPNQLTGVDPLTVVAVDERDQVAGRALVVKKLRPLPIEAVVRGYLAGSGWSDYQRTGAVCGVALAAGLKQAAKLPEPIFTPASKAEQGEHDENISLAAAQDRTARLLDLPSAVAAGLVAQAREAALTLYGNAAEYAHGRGIIIADTKFEFGIDGDNRLHLIDEVLTPDSSRFWPADEYREGSSPPSFDKQFVRDYLETLDWNKKAPGPHLPPQILTQTVAKYREAYERLSGGSLPF